MLKKLHAKALASLKRRFDSELFTYEQLRAMFIPLLLDQLFIFGIGLLSNAMVSASRQGAISALNYATAVGSLVYAVYSSVSIGTGIIIARAKGSSNALSIREAIGQGCTICTVFGSFFGLALSFFGSQIVSLLYPSVSFEIAQQAGDFLKYFGLSIIPFSLYNCIFTTFRSVGDTKSSLVLTLVINSVHLICSLIFINVLDMSVTGSALSYLAARLIGLAFALYWLMRRHNPFGMHWKDFAHYERGITKDILALGIPISVEQVLFQGGMLIVQMYLSKLNVIQTDAHGVANSMFMLYYVFGYSLTNIATTVCGQCLGAKRRDLAEWYCRNIVFIGRFVLLAAVLILYPMSPLIVKLYSPKAESMRYIYIAVALGAFPMPLIWTNANVIASANRTAGDSSFTTVVSLIALGVGRVAAGYCFTIVLKLGIAGVWLGQAVEWLLRAVVFNLRLKSGKWYRLKEVQS